MCTTLGFNNVYLKVWISNTSLLSQVERRLEMQFFFLYFFSPELVFVVARDLKRHTYTQRFQSISTFYTDVKHHLQSLSFQPN